MFRKNYVPIAIVLMVLMILTMYPMYFPGVFRKYLFNIIFTQHLVVAGFYFLFKNFLKKILHYDQLDVPLMILITLMGLRMAGDIYFLYFPDRQMTQYFTIGLVLISVAAKILMVLRILGTASGNTGFQLKVLVWTEVAEVILIFAVPVLTLVMAKNQIISTQYTIFSMNTISFMISLAPFVAMLWIILENRSNKPV